MNSDDKFAFLVIATPLIGLIYCGIGITLMISNETIREHPLISGTIFILIPFLLAASTWIRASAKAYKNTNRSQDSEIKNRSPSFVKQRNKTNSSM